jgi:transmembrane secretion effector
VAQVVLARSGPVSLLRLRDFRCLGAAMMLSATGMMAETVVLGWLTLELTNSPFLVGVAMSMRSLPLLFVGVPGGVLADRLPRHRLLIATSAGQALTSATIGVLALLGVVSLPHVLLLTFAAGAMRGVEWAARQSYTHDVVGGTELVNGLAVLGVLMRAGWLLGSLGAGTVIARSGVGLAYLVVAAAYLGGAIAIIPARVPRGTVPPTPGSVRESLAGFLVAVRTHRILPVLMTLTAGAEVLGFSHQTLLPSLARDVLHAGAEGLGALSAARAAGGIMGIFALPALRLWTGRGRFFLSVLFAFGATLVGLGLAPSVVGLAGVMAILIVVNAVGALTDLLAQSLMQLSVPAHLRGRAGGAWVLAVGLAPLGQLQIGALASLLGVSIALGASGVGLVALAGASTLLFPRLRRL